MQIYIGACKECVWWEVPETQSEVPGTKGQVIQGFGICRYSPPRSDSYEPFPVTHGVQDWCRCFSDGQPEGE